MLNLDKKIKDAGKWILLIFFWIFCIVGYIVIKIQPINIQKIIDQSIEVRLNNLQNQINTYAKRETINDIKRQIDIFREKMNSLQRDKVLGKNIENVPNNIIAKKIAIETISQQVNIMIYNTTGGSMGSGVTLKYNNKFYILSAGHIADFPEDKLELWENGTKICDLKIVKQDYTLNETWDEKKKDVTFATDLLLLQPTDEKIVPTYYTELAESEPRVGETIYIVGNPMGYEDAISDGRIIKYTNNFIEYIDHTYYGNSGGGVYNREGQLLGIVSHMHPLQPNQWIPPYMVYRAVRLNTIIDFLKEVR